jgi:hypothetical protein
MPRNRDYDYINLYVALKLCRCGACKFHTTKELQKENADLKHMPVNLHMVHEQLVLCRNLKAKICLSVLCWRKPIYEFKLTVEICDTMITTFNADPLYIFVCKH